MKPTPKIPEKIYSALFKSIVKIKSSRSSNKVIGTGFLAASSTEHGIIVTCYHVVRKHLENGLAVKVEFPFHNKEITTETLSSSVEHDICCLKASAGELPAEARPAFLCAGFSESLINQTGHTLGFPRGSTAPLDGCCTLRYYTNTAGVDIQRIDLAGDTIDVGSSGSPVILEDFPEFGVIGMVRYVSDLKKSAFLVPAPFIVAHCPEIESMPIIEQRLPGRSGSIFAYIPEDTPREEWGLALLKYCNGEALKLYRALALKTPGVTFNPHVWDEIFNEPEMDAQRGFVDIREKDTEEYVKQKFFRLLKDGAKKIWIIGNAGVGKTTILYNIFFAFLAQEQPLVPLLLQPQELNQNDLEELKSSVARPQKLFGAILKIWLKKRNIHLETSILEEVTEQLYSAIVIRDDVILLIDSYDELSRMKIQVEVFKDLFKISRQYVCATRPETYNSGIDAHYAMTIKSPWDVVTIEQYLDNRMPEHQFFTRGFVRYIRNNDKVAWLRNPRYINLIINTLNNNKQLLHSDYSKLISYIQTGEYFLFNSIFEFSLERLQRIVGKLEEAEKINVKSALVQVAKDQLNFGSFLLEDKDDAPAWQHIRKMSDLVDFPVRLSNGYQLRLLNQNIVDFLITESLVNQIYSSHSEIEFTHLWSSSLITYMSEYIHQSKRYNLGHLNREVSRKIDKCRFEKESPEGGFREFGMEETFPGFDKKYQAINLIQLIIYLEAVQLATAQKAELQEVRNQIVITPSQVSFHELYLFGLDLSELQARDCNFSGSLLEKANLERAQFKNCNFRNANMRQCSANWSKFEDCVFNFLETDQNNSAIKGMLIQGAEFLDCEHEAKDDLRAIGEKEFQNHGAIGKISRYSSPFGARFFENMKIMLGDGLEKAEKKYAAYIQDAIDTYANQGKQRILLIDLMAGGNNKRLNMLFKRNPMLSILAIDRDTRQFSHVVDKVGNRLSPVEIEIKGKVNLDYLAGQYLNAENGKVDLIIGKKALHEIPRDQQRELLADCYASLNDGGKIILFADAPICLSNEGFSKLEATRKTIRENPKDILRLRQLLFPDDSTSPMFTDSLEDCAIFSNLWILMKDHANNNIHEFENRYFSSLSELKHWAEELGLKICNDPGKDRFFYSLNSRLFNEVGINKAGIFLERNGYTINPKDTPLLRDYLTGSKRPEFQLFTNFAEHHLWGAKNSSNQPDTALGRKLDAQKEEINFGKIFEPLNAISLPFYTGISFKFSVHILVFEKAG